MDNSCDCTLCTMHRWRLEMFKYILTTADFHTEMTKGKISPELLESWGITVVLDGDDIQLFLTEIEIDESRN